MSVAHRNFALKQLGANSQLIYLYLYVTHALKNLASMSKLLMSITKNIATISFMHTYNTQV